MHKRYPHGLRNLPRLRRTQVALLEHWQNDPAFEHITEALPTALAQELSAMVHCPVRLEALSVETIGQVSSLRPQLPTLATFVMMGLGADQLPILLMVDNRLTSLIIDSLLGGNGDVARAARPLTSIEQGIFAYALLQLLTGAALSSSLPQGLGLQNVMLSPSEREAWLNAQDQLIGLSMQLHIDRHVGNVRIYLPAQAAALAAPSFSPPRGRRLRLQQLSAIATQLVVVLSEMQLSRSELDELERFDTVLLEGKDAQLDSDGLQAQVHLRFAHSQAWQLTGKLTTHAGQVQVEITAIAPTTTNVRQQPSEEFMKPTDVTPPSEDDSSISYDHGPPSEHAEALLQDISVTMVVEVGQMTLNAAEVARLRVGSVLPLQRGTDEPVRLTVNNQLVALGELIQIEDELGVRLIEVVEHS